MRGALLLCNNNPNTRISMIGWIDDCVYAWLLALYSPGTHIYNHFIEYRKCERFLNNAFSWSHRDVCGETDLCCISRCTRPQLMINAYTHRSDYSHLVVFLLFAIPTFDISEEKSDFRHHISRFDIVFKT